MWIKHRNRLKIATVSQSRRKQFKWATEGFMFMCMCTTCNQGVIVDLCKPQAQTRLRSFFCLEEEAAAPAPANLAIKNWGNWMWIAHAINWARFQFWHFTFQCHISLSKFDFGISCCAIDVIGHGSNFGISLWNAFQFDFGIPCHNVDVIGHGSNFGISLSNATSSSKFETLKYHAAISTFGIPFLWNFMFSCIQRHSVQHRGNGKTQLFKFWLVFKKVQQITPQGLMTWMAGFWMTQKVFISRWFSWSPILRILYSEHRLTESLSDI